MKGNELDEGRRAMAKRRFFRGAVVLFVFIVILVPLLYLQGVAGATPGDSWDESDFSASGAVFQVDLTRDWNGDNCRWTTHLGGIGGHWSTGVQVVINAAGSIFLLGWAPGDSEYYPIYKEYNGGWGTATTQLPAGMVVNGSYNEEDYYIEIPKSYLGGSGASFCWAINVEATWPGYSSSQHMWFPPNWGRWTAPASNCHQDSVPAEDGAGCFIATAAYGTSTAAELDTLRAFRDEVLLQNGLGSQFVALYYEVSPPLADFISGHQPLRTLVREFLVDPVVWVVEVAAPLWRN